MSEEKNILADENAVSKNTAKMLAGAVLNVAKLAKFFSGDKDVVKCVHKLCEKIGKSFEYAEYAITSDDKSAITRMLDGLAKNAKVVFSEKNAEKLHAAIEGIDGIISEAETILDETVQTSKGIGAAVEGIRNKVIGAGGYVRDKLGEGISKIKKAIGKDDSE